jgi:hypothetical protein
LGDPQKLNPASPPGRTTRRASASASSHPFQIPLKLVATLASAGPSWPALQAAGYDRFAEAIRQAIRPLCTPE